MRLRAAALATSSLFAFSIFVYPELANVEGVSSQRYLQTKRPQQRRPGRTRVAAKTVRRNYSKFSHSVPLHRQQACDVCHKFPTSNWNKVREADKAFQDVADFPVHSSCLTCHHEQFFNGRPPPICSVCHTKPGPVDSTRHPFPNPREIFDKSERGKSFVSEFQISFSHETHVDLFGKIYPDADRTAGGIFVQASWRSKRIKQNKESCKNCHQYYLPQGDSGDEFVSPPPKNLPEEGFWLKKGTFETTPASHALCFTCHTAESGLKPAESECAVCHKLLTPMPARADFDPAVAAAMGITDKTLLEKWRNREAGKYRHEWFSHAELSCAACHNVTKLNPLDYKTKKVPIATCAGADCHIGTPDSALNAAITQRKADPNFQCTKCHITFGREPVPASHSDAALSIKPK